MMVCPMTMYFHWSNDECILFKHWHPTNSSEFAWSCIAIFAFCLLREFVLYIQKYFEIICLYQWISIPLWPTSKQLNTFSLKVQSEMDSNMLHPQIKKLSNNSKKNRNAITLKLRIIDSFLYAISITIGYSLMLIIMTFNSGLILMVVWGYCVGRFIFHRQTLLLMKFVEIGVDVIDNRNNAFDNADHCRIRS
eukprot:UN04471